MRGDPLDAPVRNVWATSPNPSFKSSHRTQFSTSFLHLQSTSQHFCLRPWASKVMLSTSQFVYYQHIAPGSSPGALAASRDIACRYTSLFPSSCRIPQSSPAMMSKKKSSAIHTLTMVTSYCYTFSSQNKQTQIILLTCIGKKYKC